MTRLAGIDLHVPPQLAIPLFLLILLLVAALVARVIRRVTARWLIGSAPVSRLEDRALPSLGVPVGAAVLMAGLLAVVPELSLPGRLGRWTTATVMIGLALACAVAVSRIAVAAASEYAARNPSLTPALGVARVAIRVLVAILAIITALQSLGVPVAPLLTTLGVGSLAVALALQDTLANFFAGLYLLADRPVRLGDYVKLQEGAEGYVEAIGWRSSRLRTGGNNTVVVPNQKLSQAILTNFHLPQPPVTMTIAVRVSYAADPDVVETLLLEELSRTAAEIPAVQGAVPEVLLVEFGESGLLFHCVVSVRDFAAQGLAGHEIRKRIFARLRREHIEIPYPQRVIHNIVSPSDQRAEAPSQQGT